MSALRILHQPAVSEAGEIVCVTCRHRDQVSMLWPCETAQVLPFLTELHELATAAAT